MARPSSSAENTGKDSLFPKFSSSIANTEEPIGTVDELQKIQWREAFKFQLNLRAPSWPIDVEKECLLAFEEWLFEFSAESGPAGNQQWGLDVGAHQDSWGVYNDLPTTWDHLDRDEGMDDHEVS